MTAVNVTAEDIRIGKRVSCYLCPLALAITRVVQLKVQVIVGPAFISFWRRGVVANRKTPEDMLAFMVAFDNRKPVEPQTFKLAIPKAVLR